MADDVESIQTLVEEPKGPFKDEADKALFALLNGQMASEFDPNENVVLLREWKHRYFLEHRVFVDPKSLLPPTRVAEFVVFLFGIEIGTPNHLEVLPSKVSGFIKAAAQRMFKGGRIVEVVPPKRAKDAPNDGIPSYESPQDAKKEPFWYHLNPTRTYYRVTGKKSTEGDREDIDMNEPSVGNYAVRQRAVANLVKQEACVWVHQANATKEMKDRRPDCDSGKMVNESWSHALKFRHYPVPDDYPPKKSTPVLGTVLPRNAYAGVKELEQQYVGILTETGYAALSLLLCEIVLADKNEKLWPDEMPMAKTYLLALNWLYNAIETNFQRFRAEKMKWAFVTGRNASIPTSVTTKVQSLQNLNLRLGDQVYCSACPEEFSTYVGTTGITDTVLSFRPVDNKDVVTTEYSEIKQGSHDFGMCVQTFHSRMLDLGISPEALDTGVYSKLLGTYQQAQRRLNRYHKRQNKLYERSDSKFNWPDYLTEWLYLKMDVLLKELAGATEGKPDAPGTSNKTRLLLGTAGAVGAAVLTGGVSVAALAAGFGLGAISPEWKSAPLILFKIISFLLRSPMVQLVVEEALDKARAAMCKTMSTKATVQRTSDEGRIEELEIDTGNWVTLTEDERAKIIKKDSDIRWKKRALLTDVVARFLDDLPGEVAKNLSVLLKAAAGTMKPFWDDLKKYLMTIPWLGPVAAYLGTLSADGIMAKILGVAETAALLVSEEIRSLAEKYRSVVRVYELITANLTCETTRFLTALDGRAYGEDLFYKNYGTRLGVAYELMMEQAPFIAIDIMSTSDVDPFGKWDEEKWDRDVGNYLRFAYVPNSRDTIRVQQDIHDEKRRFLEKRRLEKRRFQDAGNSLEMTRNGKKYPLGRTGVMYPRAATSLFRKLKRKVGESVPDRDTIQDYVFPAVGALAAGGIALGTGHFDMNSILAGAALGGAGGLVAGAIQEQTLSIGDMLPGSTYEMHTVVSVSDNRDISFRSTLRYFRTKFASSGPDPVNREKLDDVNSLLFDQPDIFIALSEEDGRKFNLDAVKDGILNHLTEAIVPKDYEMNNQWSLETKHSKLDPFHSLRNPEVSKDSKSEDSDKSQDRQDPDNPGYIDRATEGVKRIVSRWT